MRRRRGERTREADASGRVALAGGPAQTAVELEVGDVERRDQVEAHVAGPVDGPAVGAAQVAGGPIGRGLARVVRGERLVLEARVHRAVGRVGVGRPAVDRLRPRVRRGRPRAARVGGVVDGEREPLAVGCGARRAARVGRWCWVAQGGLWRAAWVGGRRGGGCRRRRPWGRIASLRSGRKRRRRRCGSRRGHRHRKTYSP